MARLYLVPTTLGDYDPSEALPSTTLEAIPHIRTWVVEEVRTARRFLSKAGWRGHIEELDFHELNEHTDASSVDSLLTLFEKGDVGYMSEAGLPAVADPGAALVALCHEHGIEVIPLVGPSSLMLALMASGLNGQSFAFVGYIPAKTEERRQEIRKLEATSAKARQTQIIIETPYRNDALLKDLASCCRQSTKITIAADLTLPTQTIRTLTAAQWRESLSGERPFVIGKRPCVFLLLA